MKWWWRDRKIWRINNGKRFRRNDWKCIKDNGNNMWWRNEGKIRGKV